MRESERKKGDNKIKIQAQRWLLPRLSNDVGAETPTSLESLGRRLEGSMTGLHVGVI